MHVIEKHDKNGKGFFAIALNCDYNCEGQSSFHLYYRSSQFIHSVSFLSRVDERNELVCSPCRGLHSSASRALQRERRGHGFDSH